MGLCWFAILTTVFCTTMGKKQDDAMLVSKIGKLHFQLFKSIQGRANLVKSATFETRCSNDGCTFNDCTKGKQQCRDGWTKYYESCYKLITTTKTFLEAEAYCRTEQSSLVHIDNGNENAWIKTFRKGNTAWISGNDFNKHGEWRWLSSGRTMKFRGWARGQPENNSEHCAAFHSTGWHDYPCSDKKPFICKY